MSRTNRALLLVALAQLAIGAAAVFARFALVSSGPLAVSRSISTPTPPAASTSRIIHSAEPPVLVQLLLAVAVLVSVVASVQVLNVSRV